MLMLLLSVELILLYFLSRALTQYIARLTIRLTRSTSFAVSVVSLILYPGTVIHELSHLFTAEILGVRTGKLTLTPIVMDNKSIQSGSVAISHTNPFKRALIGVSPLFTGLLGAMSISYLLTFSLSWYYSLFLFYLLFAIVNTLFPSTSDLKGIWGVAIITILLIVSLFVLGIRVTIPDNFGDTLVWSLGLVILIDIVVILLFQ